MIFYEAVSGDMSWVVYIVLGAVWVWSVCILVVSAESKELIKKIKELLNNV